METDWIIAISKTGNTNKDIETLINLIKHDVYKIEEHLELMKQHMREIEVDQLDHMDYITDYCDHCNCVIREIAELLMEVEK